MTKDPCQEFHVSASLRRKSQAEKVVQAEGCFGLALTVSFTLLSCIVIHLSLAQLETT